MLEREELLLQAERAYKEGDFSSAVKNYRAAAQISAMDLDRVLKSLRSAEEMEQLQFIRELREQFPDSLDVRLHEARLSFGQNEPSRTIILCSEMLEQDLTQKYELSARHTRLTASAKTKNFTSFVQDFLHLWGTMTRGKQRLHLLRICSGVEATEFISAMDELSGNEIFPDEIRTFFEAKANELRHLQDASKHLGEI
jgi:hypothetical protein